MQLGLFDAGVKFDRAGRNGAKVGVIAEGIDAVPDFLHIHVRILRHALGVFEDSGGVVALTS